MGQPIDSYGIDPKGKDKHTSTMAYVPALIKRGEKTVPRKLCMSTLV